MPSAPRLLLLGALALAASGCGQLDVRLAGTVRSRVLETQTSGADEPLILTFDRLGHLTLNGRVLEVPQARERIRFGVGVVDAGALPPPWRPAHAAQGGLLVSTLQKASPLAVAGLRPFDKVESLDGVPAKDPAELVSRLGRVEPGAEVCLDVRTPEGTQRSIRARATERVGDDSRIWVPLLFDLRSSSTGQAVGTGPLDLFFRVRSRYEHRYVLPPQPPDGASPGPEPDPSRYEERFEWTFLGGLLGWESLEDLATGNTRSRLRLFWIPIGDDL